MNKYEEALDWFNGNKGWIDPYEFPEEYQELFEEMLKREVVDNINEYCKACGKKIGWCVKK